MRGARLFLLVFVLGCGSADDGPSGDTCGCTSEQVCVDGACLSASCQDGVANGDETDVDCGGDCARCAEGQMCIAPSDCSSAFCDEGVCRDCTGTSDCAPVPGTSCQAGFCLPANEPVELAASDGWAFDAQLYIDCENVHVAWSEQIAVGDVYHLRYSSSSDGGDTWSAPRWLAQPSALNVFGSLGGVGSTIYHAHSSFAAWSQGSGDISSVNDLLTSSNSGQTWSGLQTINDTAATSYSNVRMVVDSGAIDVVWDETPSDANPLRRQIVHGRSTDGGASWTKTVVSDDDTADDRTPWVQASGNTLSVLWVRVEPGPSAIYASTSADGGASWSTPVKVSHDDLVNHDRVKAAYDSTSGRLYAVWDFPGETSQDVAFRASNDMGLTWGEVSVVGMTADRDRNPSVEAIGGGEVIVLYDVTRTDANDQSTGEVDFRISLDGGASFSAATSLPGSESADYSLIATAKPACDADVHVVWSDGDPSGPDIWYYRIAR